MMNNTLALIKPDAMQKGFKDDIREDIMTVSYTHLRAHETN